MLTKCLPIDISLPTITTTDTVFKNLEVPDIQNVASPRTVTEANKVQDVLNATETRTSNLTRNSLLRQLRPGQTITQYSVELSVNGNSFDGRVAMVVRLDAATREDPIQLHVEDLDVQSVLVGILSETNPANADFAVDDGMLEIFPDRVAASYTVVVEYSGSLNNPGHGLYLGEYAGK